MNSLHSIPGFDKVLKLGLMFLDLNLVFKLIIAFVIIYCIPVLLLRFIFLLRSIFPNIGRVALIVDFLIQFTFLVAVFIIARSQALFPAKTIVQPTLLCLIIFLLFSVLPQRLFPNRSKWIRHGALIAEIVIISGLLLAMHTQTQTGRYWIHVLMGL